MPNKRFMRSSVRGILYQTRRHDDRIVRYGNQERDEGVGCRGSKGAEELQRHGFLADDIDIAPFPTADCFVRIFSEMNVKVDLDSLKHLATEMIEANDSGDRYTAERRFSDILYLLAV